MEQNYRLIKQGRTLGFNKLILPFFEESEINENNFLDYKGVLLDIVDAAQEASMRVCIESIFNGDKLMKFLDFLSHPNIKVVYDRGNRIAFGHDIYSDIILLGDRIEHIHIKDKDNINENVLLGTGSVNFKGVVRSLLKIGYKGPYTFEMDRVTNPVKTAEYNLSFMDFFLKNASGDHDEN